MLVDELTVKLVAGVPPKVTAVTPNEVGAGDRHDVVPPCHGPVAAADRVTVGRLDHLSHEDVSRRCRYHRTRLVGIGGECQPIAVVAEGGERAIAVAWTSPEPTLTRWVVLDSAVADEYIPTAVGVAGHQVRTDSKATDVRRH